MEAKKGEKKEKKIGPANVRPFRHQGAKKEGRGGGVTCPETPPKEHRHHCRSIIKQRALGQPLIQAGLKRQC